MANNKEKSIVVNGILVELKQKIAAGEEITHANIADALEANGLSRRSVQSITGRLSAEPRIKAGRTNHRRVYRKREEL